MSPQQPEHDHATLPKPIALNPDQLRQVAAGTAGILPATSALSIIAGPFPVGPIWLTPIGGNPIGGNPITVV